MSELKIISVPWLEESRDRRYLDPWTFRRNQVRKLAWAFDEAQFLGKPGLHVNPWRHAYTRRKHFEAANSAFIRLAHNYLDECGCPPYERDWDGAEEDSWHDPEVARFNAFSIIDAQGLDATLAMENCAWGTS